MPNPEIEKTELSDDQLDQVAGGAMRTPMATRSTTTGTTNSSNDTTSSTDTSTSTATTTTTAGDGTGMMTMSP